MKTFEEKCLARKKRGRGYNSADCTDTNKLQTPVLEQFP
jgi:hypothetical protein